ncbi:hypothetical protein DFH05DRAFT_1464554 [Lentinula detonsa]|uniref:Uncharacterized protein n=1 Tax=Lentinula detonsa TaxID=2804962 RepID=A0A9W8NQ64_9AGAR|nr:hypothetical protein DFH05DRAFT_1464554 [Lentinula detonsa]
MDEERGLDGARQQDQAERDATLQELASLQERLPAAVAIVNNSLGSSINKVEAQVRFVQAHENDTRTVQEELRESKLQVANLTGELTSAKSEMYNPRGAIIPNWACIATYCPRGACTNTIR